MTDRLQISLFHLKVWIKKVKECQIDLKRVNEVFNIVQFEWIQNYLNIEKLCVSSKDASNMKETNYFLRDGNVNYWIQLNSFGVQQYNCYIHLYHL